MLKTAISGTIQRGPERHTHQTGESITQARRRSTQTLQRPWGTTAITRWGLLSGLNHCVGWCLARRSGRDDSRIRVGRDSTPVFFDVQHRLAKFLKISAVRASSLIRIGRVRKKGWREFRGQ